MRVTITGANGGIPWANVFHVRNGGTAVPTPNDLLQFTTTFYNAYVSHFASHMATTISILQCVALYQEADGNQFGADYNATQPGTQAGQVLPAQVSCCISWTVQQRYRGGHPRTYLPPTVAASTLNSNQWQQSYVDSVRQSANDFHAVINAYAAGALGDLHLGTVSFVKDRAWRTPPVFRDYSPGFALVDARIDTQRRRLGRDV